MYHIVDCCFLNIYIFNFYIKNFVEERPKRYGGWNNINYRVNFLLLIHLLFCNSRILIILIQYYFITVKRKLLKKIFFLIVQHFILFFLYKYNKAYHIKMIKILYTIVFWIIKIFNFYANFVEEKPETFCE